MKFNLKTLVLDYAGKPMIQMVEGNPKETEAINFRRVISAALNREGAPVTPEDKQKVYQISIKIWKSWKVELTHDDCAFIKTRAGLTLDPLLVGRLDDFLENREVEMPEEDEEEKDAEPSKVKP